MEDDEITHWLELPAGMGFVPFSELAHLIARALFPVASEDEEYDFDYCFTRVNLEEELPKAVDAKLLVVRDSLTHGRHTFPHGFSLQSAVVKVSDLRDYLADRGMGVRVTEAGNGPTHWTIGNAAAAIASQQGWHGGARDTLKEQMMQAARDGTLTVRHPHTDTLYRPDPVRDFYETVTPADVNTWLGRDPAGSLRWLHAAPEPAPPAQQVPAMAAEVPPVNGARSEAPGWKHQARDEARRIRKERVAQSRFPGLEDLGDEVARLFRERGITGPNGHALTGSYIKRHALQGHGITADTDRLKATLNTRGK